MKKMKTVGRILALMLALCIAVALFAACGKEAAPDYSLQASDNDDPTVYFARILPKNAEAREKFTAAARGYNMSAEGFDDDHLPEPDPTGVSLDGARAALDLVKPTDYASEQKFNEFRAALTAEQVTAIVENMKENVDFSAKRGFIATILTGIGQFLRILTKLFGGSYVWALFLFAIVVEILLLPFAVKQQKNSIKQARMRPKEMAIRKKYAGRNDQATQRKMNEEIQRLYQQEGFNPMGGCLPMLIQLPIILALYQIVIDPLQYVLGKVSALSSALTTYCTTAKAAGGLGMSLGTKSRGTIELLSKVSAEDLEGLKNFAYFKNAGACYDALEGAGSLNFNLFGGNMGLTPNIIFDKGNFKLYWWLIFIPILTFGFYFASMKIMRKLSFQPMAVDQQTGCSNNIMDITMPLMSVYIAFIVPAAVGIYWIFKSIISTGRQFIMYKVMPLPVFTEEDYKAAERELKGKAKPEKKQPGERTTKSGVQVRSLHHIDDDDEPLPPPVPDPVEYEDDPEPKPVKTENGKNKSGKGKTQKEPVDAKAPEETTDTENNDDDKPSDE